MQTMITIALVFIFRLNVFMYFFCLCYAGNSDRFWNSAHLPTFYLTWCAYHITYNA